ncbi:unnamed protein product [Camellia sinensis]
MEPIGYVPVLVDEDIVLSDSFAILMYLEEKYPQHPLLPRDLQRRGINYQKYIGEKVPPDEKLVWVQYHIGKGFAALEKLLKDYAGKYATGDEVCLVFSNNMGKKSELVITKCKESENWTKVIFKPDLAKFNMTRLEDDVVALMKKRVIDLARCLGKTVKIDSIKWTIMWKVHRLEAAGTIITSVFSCVRRMPKYVEGGVDGGRPSSASIFVGGFVLGGIVVGALGCIYAPQISKALAGADRKDLMKKLSKFICDEEKGLERTRKILTEKIAQLNSAIDDVSSQLRADDTPNGTAVSPDELEASI